MTKTKRKVAAPAPKPKVERDPAIFAFFMKVAEHQKAWANRTWVDEKWKKGASIMSLEMLKERYTKPVNELAEKNYDYFKYRAGLTYNPYGGSQTQKTDPAAANMWDALEQGDPSLLFKHFGVVA